MTAKRKKAYPQLIAIELILVALAGLAVWYLLPMAGTPHSVALIAAGVAADRTLIMLLRHRNKKLLPKFKLPVTVSMTQAARKAAPKKG